MSKRRLHEVLGLPDPERTPHEGVPRELLARALDFRLAGGVVGLADWEAQSPLERQALVEAGRRLLAMQREGPEEPPRPHWAGSNDDPERRPALRLRGLRALGDALGRHDPEQLWQELALFGLGRLAEEVAEGRLSVTEAVQRFELRRQRERATVERVDHLREMGAHLLAL